MRFRGLRKLVASDLYRYAGKTGFRAFWTYFLTCPGFTFSFWLRMAAWTGGLGWPGRVAYPLTGLIKRHYSIKYGIYIPRLTKIGPGFYIGHFGGIVVHGDCRIGRDCNMSHGVTLGQANRGKHAGVPVIGDRVYLGPGAKIVGAVRVGSDVAVGANAVVTSDVPDGAVVGGVPARIISYAGSESYINRTDYPDPLRGY